MRRKIDGDKDKLTSLPSLLPRRPSLPPPVHAHHAFLWGSKHVSIFFSLLPWDVTYLFLCSCFSPRSAATTHCGVLLAKACLYSGRSSRWNGQCALLPGVAEWQLNVDPSTLHDFQCCIQQDFAWPTCLKPLLQSAHMCVGSACTIQQAGCAFQV